MYHTSPISHKSNKKDCIYLYRIPAPKAPSMNILSEVVTEAFGVALVGYVASLALAQGSAKQFKYSVDDNQVKHFLFSASRS